MVATMVQSSLELDKATSKKLHPFFGKGPIDPNSNSPLAKTAIDQSIPHDEAQTLKLESGNSRKKRRTGDLTTSEDSLVTKKPRKNESIASQLSKTDDTAATEDPFSASAALDTSPKPDLSKTSPPPKKILKFNLKTGTLGSPPKAKQDVKPSRIVTVKYGNDNEHRNHVGDKITQILEGNLHIPITPTKRRPQRKAKRPDYTEKLPEEPYRSTHPFFTGKAKPSTEPTKPVQEPKDPPPRRNVISMSTPISPRKPRVDFIEPKVVNWAGMKPSGTKVPGSMYPMWPCQEMMHVRGESGAEPALTFFIFHNESSRKYKGQKVQITAKDSMLTQVAKTLDLDNGKLPLNEPQVDSTPTELRLPKRIFESGRRLRNRVAGQLYCRPEYALLQYGPGIDELSKPQPGRLHPAIIRLYNDLETNLSAYDRSGCENLAWTHKYAPLTASQVLHAGKDAFLLKDWLEALRVQSVGTGNTEKTKGRPDKTAKKRRKNKLDGFVVDSDEEEEMEEVSEDEADWLPAGPNVRKKTIVKALKEPARLANALIMSGPHGSGKTAAVYAVAKELGFEIFEINAGSRRSGKDILERVGDMTRNHLVHHHRPETAIDEEAAEDEVARDLKSGKQGMMTAFFKPKLAAAFKKPKQAKKEEKTREETKPVHKSQKQSLILLEEVDVLYEEDKHFWATLIGLIAQSKRPFIMTCNDESLVPIQSLNLHGILRFSPPPSELAVDTCLLIAANEGHALERSAVDALYESRGHDLRATITELNFWCQIGVGDRRGGFDWFFLRWPKGCDVDENGDVIRVVSKNTYVKGMGWLTGDLLPNSKDKLEVEEELIHQCWDSWKLPASDWHTSLNMEGCTHALDCTATRRAAANLESYQQLCEAQSDADLCSNGVFGENPLQDRLNPGIPDMPSKTREDFTVGRQLLHAEPFAAPADPSMNISVFLSCLARQFLWDFNRCSWNPSSISPDPFAYLHVVPLGMKETLPLLQTSFTNSPFQLTRHDIALALDPIATSDIPTLQSYLDPSVFDRTITLIVTDVAPWIRGIVAYDQALQLERKKLSSLLSEGGTGKKRMRNTRAAYSALEGGERGRTRRERYFRADINPGFVLHTGLEDWRDAVKVMDEGKAVESSEAEGMEG